MADFVLGSLRRGMNNTDPAIALPDDQCVLAQNVEWRSSMLGERRRGSIPIDVTSSDLEDCDRIVWVHRHLPTTNDADAQLWALGITDGSPDAAVLAYKDTTWHTVSMSDALTIDGVSEYEIQGLSLHGKLFIAYNSAVDRLHVWDGTTFRRCGLMAPSAPTVSDYNSGTFSGTRYYRVRMAVYSGDVAILRSEPSEATTFAPSGTGLGATINKPDTISENETHWELEASLDNVNFYVRAVTAVGTGAFTDETSYVSGYATTYELSEDIGDYTLLPSARFLVADEDRLVFGGSSEESDAASQIGWTPVFNADGVGDDERMEADTDPTLSLDGFEGGSLTGLAKPTTGSVWAFKLGHVYKLVRRNQRTRAYDVVVVTKTRGAVPFSIVEGSDQLGRPALFFYDTMVGPCIAGIGGLVTCGSDLLTTWQTVNRDAALVCRSLSYPEARQVYWWVATVASETPDTRVVLHTNLMRDAEDGKRGGWAVWTGPSAAALTACLFADNINDDTTRSLTLAPVLGVEGADPLLLTDTGTDDNGTAYTGRILTKPYAPGKLLHAFNFSEAWLIATAAAGVTVDVGLSKDFGLETSEVSSVSLTPTGSEAQVIKHLDNAALSELRTVQIDLADSSTPTGRWELNHLALMAHGEQRA